MRPINAAVVLKNRKATFTPITTVYIWLQANLVSRTVVTEITAPTAIATFTGATTEQSLKYNPDTGLFMPVSQKGAFLAEAPSYMAYLNEAVV